MKCEAQSSFSTDGQQAFEQHARALQQMEDLSSVTIRNYLGSLQCFIAWCEYPARRTGRIAVCVTSNCSTSPHPLPIRFILVSRVFLKKGK